MKGAQKDVARGLVFISHASSDRNQVVLMESYLRSNGVDNIWMDLTGIQGGDKLTPTIIRAIKDAKCCVALLSQDFAQSQWCNMEIGAFLGTHKPIILYQCLANATVPPSLVGERVCRTPEEVLAALPKECKSSDGLSLQTLRKSGLRNAFRIKMQNPQRQDRIRELVAEEMQSGKGQFLLAASSGFNYLRANGHVWLDAGLGRAIHSGAQLTVVLQSPFSSFALARALSCEDVEHHHWEEKVSERELEELSKLENVRVHVTECPVNCSVFFTSKSVFFDPYLWAVPEVEKKTGRPENNFWVLEFRKADDSQYDCYELLRLHFDFLLKHSEALESFLHADAVSYKERSEQFRQRTRHLRLNGGHLDFPHVR